MDTTIESVGAVVVAELRAAGYMESTIGQYRKAIRYFTDFAGQGRVYTPELGARFAALTTSPYTGRFSAQRRFMFGRLVRVFDSYVCTGQVDLSVRTRGGGGPHPVGEEFVALNAAWEADMVERSLAAATREAYGRVARSFLVFLEARGIRSLDDADGAMILAFLESLLDRWAKSSLFWVVSNFRPFLKFIGRDDLVVAVSMAGVKRSHAIIPVLADDDADRVMSACADGVVPARDAAITLLALTTGLRACDIIGLRLADIEWRTCAISVIQQKTGNPLRLPLPKLLVVKLAEYVSDGRPATGDAHVFVRMKAPHTRLADHASVYRITADVFRKAGVADVKAGTRFLRHNAASRLVAASVPLPTIAAVLGHSSSESTNQYMNVDTRRLHECVLPVPAGALS